MAGFNKKVKTPAWVKAVDTSAKICRCDIPMPDGNVCSKCGKPIGDGRKVA